MDTFQISPSAPKGVLIDDMTHALEKAKSAVCMVQIALIGMSDGDGPDYSPEVLAGVLWGAEGELERLSELARHAFETSVAKGGERHA